MKKMMLLVLVVVAALTMGVQDGCERKPTTNDKLAVQQEQMQSDAIKQTGMPAIVNFQERKIMKRIIESRDKTNLITYTYLWAEQPGTIKYIGKSIGYGLPYSTQYTNPMKIEAERSQTGYAILPQADPNGLFMPSSADGTWVMMINPKTNNPEAVYFEPKVIVSPFPLPTNLHNPGDDL